MATSITISRKSSGNYFIGQPTRNGQTVAFTTTSINEMLDFWKEIVKSGVDSKLVKHDYSRTVTYYNNVMLLSPTMWEQMGMENDTNGRDARVEILNEREAERKTYYDQKIADREKQIEICLSATPIDISQKEREICFTASLGGTPMIEAYHGCGKGTAYIREGALLAFHYGYDQPSNIPTNCEAVRVEMSGCQVCFF